MALALLDLGHGRPDRALDRLETAARGAADGSVGLMNLIHFAGDQVEAAVRAGLPERADAALARFEQWSLATRQPWAEGVLLRCRGLVSTGDEAGRHFANAARVHAKGGVGAASGPSSSATAMAHELPWPGMEFFCYHRDRPDSLALRHELAEAHWSYMDRFAEELIARGPTFDGETLSGSVHIVDLPDPAAARAFAFDEPNYQAGAYRDVLLRRWRNLLGRTMWDFPGGPGDRFLVLGFGAGPAADLDVPSGRDDLIAYGPLLSDDGGAWLGTAALVQAPGPDAARAVLTRDRYAAVEVHQWEPGGRR